MYGNADGGGGDGSARSPVMEEERYPVLSSDESKGIYGPGHNNFTVDEEGNDILVFHARTETEIVGDPLYNPNRHTMLMKIKWDEQGRPVFRFDD